MEFTCAIDTKESVGPCLYLLFQSYKPLSFEMIQDDNKPRCEYLPIVQI